MRDVNIRKIIEYLDKYMIANNCESISPVDANKYLKRAGLLNDSKDRPGKPLRDLLRKKKLPHAFQEGGKGSSWLIPLSPSGKLIKNSDSGSNNEIDDDSDESGIHEDSNPHLDDIPNNESVSELRRQLLEAYGSQCAISGFEIPESLEAAHIVPYLGPATNHITNGILLRADIRVLFDKYLLTIDPSHHEIILSTKLENTSYSDLKGNEMFLPKKKQFRPDTRSLQYHYDEFMKLNG